MHDGVSNVPSNSGSIGEAAICSGHIRLELESSPERRVGFFEEM
jgi:hypothetical protein